MSDNNVRSLNTGYQPDTVSRNEIAELNMLVFDLIEEIGLLRDRVSFLTSILNQITTRE